MKGHTHWQISKSSKGQSQMYLRRPKSQITICFKRLYDLYDVRHIRIKNYEPKKRLNGKKMEETAGKSNKGGIPQLGLTHQEQNRTETGTETGFFLEFTVYSCRQDKHGL